MDSAIGRRWWAAVAACALLGGSPAQIAIAQARDDGERGRPEPDNVPKCVTVRTATPYRAYGYDHVVSIQNECKKPVSCTVVTDVNPERSELRVEPGKTEEVVTFRGSPAREFKADVSCKEVS